jgi:hypothetical protein
MLLQSSIMILENIFTGITHGDHMFVVQVTGLSFQLKMWSFLSVPCNYSYTKTI